MKKRLLPGLLAAALTLSLVLPAAAAEKKFEDVPEDYWAAADIAKAVERGFMQGTSDTKFTPERALTYAEFLAMLVRQFYPGSAGEDGTPWYGGYIAANRNLLAGAAMDNPDAVIDRYEMALILCNAMKAAGMEVTALTDTSAVADWDAVPENYRDAVSACYSMGIINGTDAQGSFGGAGSMTRSQAAAVVNRLIDAGPAPQQPAEGETAGA